MTAIYLAARFDSRERLSREVVPQLRAAGHRVTSSWLAAEADAPVLDAADLALDPSAGIVPGRDCLADIRDADMVAVFTQEPSTTGGYHVEFGYALALGKPIELVGPLLNVFHALPVVVRHQTIADFIQKYTA